MTVALAVSPVNSLVLHSACIGGVNAPRFNDFLAQTRQDLDPDEDVIFIYDGAPEYRNPAIPAGGQYRAGDAPGLQPIPEHSGTDNRLIEGREFEKLF